MAMKDWNLEAAEEAGQQDEMICQKSIFVEEIYQEANICSLDVWPNPCDGSHEKRESCPFWNKPSL